MDIDGKIYCSRCMREIEAEGTCPHCGYHPCGKHNTSALEQGTLLNGRYQLGTVIGQGGFGITYAAWDEILGAPVAVKEYFPMDFCNRNTDVSDEVVPLESRRAAYLDGLCRFQRESHLLAELQGIPEVVKVLDFFPENETTYIAMEYIHGVPLDEWVREKKLGTKEILKLMRPVFDALVQTHRQGVLHRDLTPGNMLVREDGTVKLIDFGSAAELERSGGTVVLTRKYAAVEQYGQEHGAQGPWTDVYGLAAVTYAMLTGTEPQESVLRVYNDELKSTRKCGVSLKKEQHTAIMNALAVDPGKRTQSMEEFRARLYRLPMPQEIIRRRRTMRRIGIAAAILLLLLAAVLANFSVGLPLSEGLLVSLRGDGWHITKATGAAAERILPESVLGIPVTAVESNAFREDMALEKVEVPGSVRTIGDAAFYGCPELNTVILNEGVTQMGISAFAECPELMAAELPKSLGEIPDDMFRGASDDLLIRGKRGSAANVYALERQLQFWDESEMSFEPVEGGMMLTRLKSEAEHLVIPSYVDGLPVVAIADGIEINHAVTLELPKHLTIIPESICAHNGDQLTTLVMGPEVREIRACAFKGCHNLKDFDWPADLEVIGDSAFDHCFSLQEIILPGKVTSIGMETFCYCTGLETVRLPDNVREIGKGCFRDTRNLREIRLPEGLKDIPEYVFTATGLNHIHIPESVETIGERAFAHSPNLDYMLVPASVRTVGKCSFSDCGQLKWLEFLNDEVMFEDTFDETIRKKMPDLIIGGRKGSSAEQEAGKTGCPFEDIGEWTEGFVLNGGTAEATSDMTADVVRVPWYNEAEDCPIVETSGFSNIWKLAAVNLSLFQDEIHDREFSNCSKMEVFQPIWTIRKIGDRAFESCESLYEVSVPDGLTEVGSNAFKGCTQLKTVNLPDSVTDIGAYAFSGCESLKQFRIPAGIRELRDFLFANSGIEELVIPGTVTHMHSGVANMDELFNLIIEDGVEEFDSVRYCMELRAIVFPPSMKEIRSGALKECGSLSDIWVYNPQMKISDEADIVFVYFHGYQGSTAKTYAAQNGHIFEAIKGTFADAEYQDSLMPP